MVPYERDLERAEVLNAGKSLQFWSEPGMGGDRDGVARPAVLIPAVLMVGVVATGFMDVGRGPGTVRLFAITSLLWLIILLGLGSLDPMTRTMYLVETVYRN